MKQIRKMKKIKLERYQTPDKKSIYVRELKYSFYYNGKTILFDSKRDCESYIVNINDCLNVLYNELNIIYIKTFEIYRKYMFFYSSSMFHKFKIIDMKFDNTYKSIETTNASTFVFANAQMIINELIEVFYIFEKIELQKRTYDKNYEIRIYINRLLQLKEDFSNL